MTAVPAGMTRSGGAGAGDGAAATGSGMRTAPAALLALSFGGAPCRGTATGGTGGTYGRRSWNVTYPVAGVRPIDWLPVVGTVCWISKVVVSALLATQPSPTPGAPGRRSTVSIAARVSAVAPGSSVTCVW